MILRVCCIIPSMGFSRGPSHYSCYHACYRRSITKRNAAVDGAPHSGAQNRGRRTGRLEERRALRADETEFASSLRPTSNQTPRTNVVLGCGPFCGLSGSRVSIHQRARPGGLPTEAPLSRYSPSDNRTQNRTGGVPSARCRMSARSSSIIPTTLPGAGYRETSSASRFGRKMSLDIPFHRAR
jgi:hypothetical protein